MSERKSDISGWLVRPVSWRLRVVLGAALEAVVARAARLTSGGGMGNAIVVRAARMWSVGGSPYDDPHFLCLPSAVAVAAARTAVARGVLSVPVLVTGCLVGAGGVGRTARVREGCGGSGVCVPTVAGRGRGAAAAGRDRGAADALGCSRRSWCPGRRTSTICWSSCRCCRPGRRRRARRSGSPGSGRRRCRSCRRVTWLCLEAGERRAFRDAVTLCVPTVTPAAHRRRSAGQWRRSLRRAGEGARGRDVRDGRLRWGRQQGASQGNPF